MSSLMLHVVALLAAVVKICYSDHCDRHQCLLSNMSWRETVEKGYRLKIITVATEETDGYKRFMRSAKFFNLDVEVFGLGDEWRNRDKEDRPGGYEKLGALRQSLLKYKDQKKLILMFTDSYETIFVGDKSTIVNKFKNTGSNILISAEDYCWPDDKSLKARYLVRERGDGYRYLCSTGIIGYAPAVYRMLSLMWIEPTSEYQLDYRHIFLDDRKKYGIRWDRRAELFQNLNGYKDVVVLTSNGSDFTLVNSGFKTWPVVIHGNGPSKVHLTYLANYVPNVWTERDGCLNCKEDMFNLQAIVKEKWPRVLIGIFVNIHSPFVDSFLERITALEYPKDKIDVFLFNAIEEHKTSIEQWIYEMEVYYKSIRHEGPDGSLTDMQARNMGTFHCRKVSCDYYFSVDSAVSLTNRRTLQRLIEQNRPFIAPMVTNPSKYWKANFWGDLTLDGHYLRSPDFFNITQRIRRGVWNMPYVRDVYLIKSSVLKRIGVTPFHSEEFNSFFQFSTHLREKGVFMHVTNMEYFGYLKDMKSLETEHKHNELYQLNENTLDWEVTYLDPHLRWIKANIKGATIDQPCPDVYMFPVMTQRFADHLIDEFEKFGRWYKDYRIPGGYGNIATSALRNVGLEESWRYVLKQYITPIVNRLFPGYTPNFDTSLDMVSKLWKTDYELPLFNDTSVFTVSVALNEGGVEYQGGGEKYTRYNCAVSHAKVGWALIRPGGFTHQYKNIATTEGSRYILLSLVGMQTT